MVAALQHSVLCIDELSDKRPRPSMKECLARVEIDRPCHQSRVCCQSHFARCGNLKPESCYMLYSSGTSRRVPEPTLVPPLALCHFLPCSQQPCSCYICSTFRGVAHLQHFGQPYWDRDLIPFGIPLFWKIRTSADRGESRASCRQCQRCFQKCCARRLADQGRYTFRCSVLTALFAKHGTTVEVESQRAA
jgi:hypothetical protein